MNQELIEREEARSENGASCEARAILTRALRKSLSSKAVSYPLWVDRVNAAIKTNCALKELALLEDDVYEALVDKQLLTKEDLEVVADWAKVQRVGSVAEFAAAVNLCAMSERPLFEFQLYDGSRWYPSKLTANIWRGMFGTVCSVEVKYNVCDIASQHRVFIESASFKTDDVSTEFSMDECLRQYGLRLLTPDAMSELERQLEAARKLNARPGLLVDCDGDGCYKVKGYFGGIGKTSMRGLACVEPHLESGAWQEPQLPFVRVFDLTQKRYLCVDVRDLAEHEYDRDCIDRLVLPSEMESTVKAVFSAGNEAIFGDLMRGRHGGMVVLASGPPGVGKTFTAETYAESSGRPLYVMGLGELGTQLHEVEENLKLIFERAARWNAVLLFDEAEIFLAKRDMNLERSAIVGVFLRLLDYYRGMFFMTTNRPEVIDDAFKSRITLHLRYQELTANGRLKVWSNMLAAAGIEVLGEEFDNAVAMAAKDVKELQINGRQVRNVCRLARVIYPQGKVTLDQLKAVIKLSCG